MVAEQRETVQRIDADTLDIASNVGGAQRELLKYYASISSNRWLMLKVFGVLIVFVSFLFEKSRALELTESITVFGVHSCLGMILESRAGGPKIPWTLYLLRLGRIMCITYIPR